MLTNAQMRERVEEIAIEAYVDARDHAEPLELLITRVRTGLHNQLEQLAELFQQFEAELDEFENAIAENNERQ